MKRPLVMEDIFDDLAVTGPMTRAYCRARVQEFKGAGLGGESLAQAVAALEDARAAAGTGPHWRLAEAVKAHHLNQGGDNATSIWPARAGNG